jgi:large subunit ribosomal protein L17
VRIVEDGGQFEEVDVVQKLFDVIAPRYAARPGGYTRLVKMGKRPGDNADMAVLMLVEEA